MRLLYLVLLVPVALLMGEPDEKPNIILVMADDQGWGDMAYNGHPHVKTPNFDAVAKEGIRFDRFYAAAPVCSPTRASVLTGRTPNRSGTLSWGHPLRPQEVTLPTLLKAVGYRTGHFGKWHIGSTQIESPVHPGAHGFDEWISAPNFFDLDPILSDQGTAVKFEGDSSDITVDLAISFIQEAVKEETPFFAVVWFASPHIPHEALEEDWKLYEDRPERERHFLGEITAMDRAFGRLRTELRDLGIHENTVLWYISDNGALPRFGSTGGARGFKASVYDGGLLVPGLLEWPAKFPEPAVIAQPAVSYDIFPTVLEFADIRYESDRPIDGISLLPLLQGETEERTEAAGFWDHTAPGRRVPAKEWLQDLYEAQQENREVEDKTRLYLDAAEISPVPTDQFPGHSAWLEFPWKLHRIENPAGTVRWELYNLADDPAESKNLQKEEAERMADMRSRFEPWLESVARSLGGEDYDS